MLVRAGARATRPRRSTPPPRDGEILFSPHFLYVFEATSILILAALVGAVVLARKEACAWTAAAVFIQPALLLSLVLFALGALGVFLRRNVITIFMCVELMLNAVNLAFVAF